MLRVLIVNVTGSITISVRPAAACMDETCKDGTQMAIRIATVARVAYFGGRKGEGRKENGAT